MNTWKLLRWISEVNINWLGMTVDIGYRVFNIEIKLTFLIQIIMSVNFLKWIKMKGWITEKFIRPQNMRQISNWWQTKDFIASRHLMIKIFYLGFSSIKRS